MSQNHTHSRLAGFHTVADAKGALGSIPVVLSCYVSPSASISRLVTHCWIYPLTPPLCLHLWIHFHLHRLSRRPHTLYIYKPFSRHHRSTRATSRRYVSRNISYIVQVMMYWAMVLWRRRTYVSTSSSTAASIDASKGKCSRRPSA